MSKFVVVDEILGQLEAAKSGVVPGSVCQAVVSGVQNVPGNIIQKGLEAGGGCYTTFPLSPILKNCCLDKTYLNLEFDVNLGITFSGLTNGKEYKIPFWIGFRDTASIFNQVQILIENTALYTTVYHREESVIAYNSLPETEVRGNPQYSSIDKLRNCTQSPMKRIIFSFTAADTSYTIANQSIHYKLTVDINRLMPILSNMHYTTPHFGNLKLKVWLQKIQEAMFFCPDYNYTAYTSSAVADRTQPFMNQYYSFYPLSTYIGQTVQAAHIPVYAVNTTDHSVVVLTSFKIDVGTTSFMSFNGGIAEIVQTCFEIKNEEYQRLTDYFTSIGSIIIPTQTWETGVYNNSSIDAGTQWIQTQTGTIGGYNVNFVSTWAHPSSQATCFQKEFLTDVQMLLDGRPINSLPYSYINDKCVVDTTQAIIDTDHEEINKDYVDSLTCFSITDTPQYSSAPFSTVYGTGQLKTSINRNYLSNPNTFCLNFSTNLPDAFHSGACILENSNRNGVLRFISSNAADSNAANLATTTYPYVMNHRNLAAANNTSTTIVGYTAFCDCCLVLTYDAARGTCFDGQLSWAAPYM